MQRDLKKKLKLNAETLRALDEKQLGRAVGGISGLRGCHSIDIRCSPGSGGALCNPSDDGQCYSGLICP